MLCKVLFVISGLVCISGNILNKDVNIKVCGDCGTLQRDLQGALSEIQAKISEIDKEFMITKIAAFIPAIGSTIAGAFSTFIEKVKRNIIFEELAIAIKSDVEKTVVTDKNGDMQAYIKAIAEQFHQLKNPQLDEHDIKSKMNIVQNELIKLINIYSAGKTIMRTYAELTITPFATISTLLHIFEPLSKKIIPSSSSTYLACQLQDLTDLYSFLYVYNRFLNIKVFSNCEGANFVGGSGTRYLMNRMLQKKASSETIYHSYSPAGYNQTNYLECDGYSAFIEDDGHNAVHFQCSQKNCALGYFELVRHAIERRFYDIKNSLNDICTRDYRASRRVTDFGNLIIIIISAWGDQNQCEWHSPCDLYVYVRLNENFLFKTPVIEAASAHFFEKIEIENISKHSRLWMDLSDLDEFGRYDLLVSEKGEVGKYIEADGGVSRFDFESGNSGFRIMTFWTPNYENNH